MAYLRRVWRRQPAVAICYKVIIDAYSIPGSGDLVDPLRRPNAIDQAIMCL
jgi:hypothetical protein